MVEKLSLWEAAKREMEEYQFIAGAELQPKWDVSEKIAINAAVSGRFESTTSLAEYVDAASSVIEAGACGVHIDFSFMTDEKGRRLDRDIPPVEAYSAVLEPLRSRFGNDFVPNLNVLNRSAFDECVSPAPAGLTDAQDMTRPMFLMVDQIRKIDPTSVISVCAAGRATLYMTTLATMMGLHIRVGTEDTPWKYPNSDERLKDNLEMFNMARDIAGLLGRKPASANEDRALVGQPDPT